jgi:hypothetical protein
LRRRRIRTLRGSVGTLALVLALVGSAGCGGEEEQAAPGLPRGLASALAERSDAVAAKLDAGDACGARADAEELREASLAAIDDGRVPPPYRRELAAAVTALAASLTCPAAAPAEPTAPGDTGETRVEEDEADEPDVDEERGDEHDDDAGDDDDEKDDRKGKEGKGKGKGKKGGRG